MQNNLNCRRLSRFHLPVLCVVTAFVCYGCIATESLQKVNPFSGRQKVKAHYLNMRSEPSIQGKILTVLDKGTSLSVSDVSGKWVKVKTWTGKEGWVYGKHITGFDHLFQAQAAKPEKITKTADPEYQAQETDDGQDSTPGTVTPGEQPAAFIHPGGIFSLVLPPGWRYVTVEKKDFESYIFKNDDGTLEFQIKAVLAKNYDDSAFYRDLASLLMEQFGTATSISATSRKTDTNNRSWLCGTVTINNSPRMIHDIRICESSGLLFAAIATADDRRHDNGLKTFNALWLGLTMEN